MKNNAVSTENIQKKKDDSKEFAELLKRVPPERKRRGFGTSDRFCNLRRE